MSVPNEEAEALIRELNRTIGEVRKAVGGKAGEGNEKKYGVAYQQCVKAGVKPQIRRKYRRGV